MDTPRKESDHLQAIPARLGLVDAVCIIVGIIIGVGIFETPAEVFHRAPGPWAALGLWALGGLIALAGALCFAELASTYPRSGGEYVYLSRAYGPTVGFLFGWAQLSVIRPGSIAAVAYIFAVFAARLGGWGPDSLAIVGLAVLAIAFLTAINVLGVVLGTRTQNLLTLAKIVGLAAIVLVGFFWAQPSDAAPLAPRPDTAWWFAPAMIFILWTYSGWQEACYVAAEVKHNQRNLPRAILWGTLAVTAIYLLVNAACLVGLGFDSFRSESATKDFLSLFASPMVQGVMCLLVMISALGGINGMIFTTARIYAEFGADHPPFTKLSRWSRRWGTPVHALVVQGGISLLMVVGVGLIWGSRESFNSLVDGTAAVTWLFFLLTGLALFILRLREPGVFRPFRVPGYPVLPVFFCLSCAFMMGGAIVHAPEKSFLGLAILVLGFVFFVYPKNRRAPVPKESPVLTGVGQDV